MSLQPKSERARGAVTWFWAGLWVVSYFVARGALERPDLDQPIRIAAALVPMFPFGLFLWGFIREVAAMDELERTIQLKALAVAYPVALLLLMLLGLLELAVPLDRDNFSYQHVWQFLIVFYFGGVAIVRARYQ